MNTAIQTGYKIKYHSWTDWKHYERIVEGAVRFKKNGLWNCYPDYTFYDKKGKAILWLKQCDISVIEKIYTTVLEESKESWVRVIIDKIKKLSP